MTGATGTAVNFDNAIIRAADEGVPLAAIKRIFKMMTDTLDIRSLLHAAVNAGRLPCMPLEDWYPGAPRDKRLPTVPEHKLGSDDVDLVMKLAKKMRTTKLESRILVVLLRRGHASREQLHDVVESNRGNPAEVTQEKIVDVVVCKLRKKLVPLGITLRTVHSIGYEMAEVDRQKIWGIVNEQ
jgi:Transcriptional regulatory protein, C terminal